MEQKPMAAIPAERAPRPRKTRCWLQLTSFTNSNPIAHSHPFRGNGRGFCCSFFVQAETKCDLCSNEVSPCGRVTSTNGGTGWHVVCLWRHSNVLKQKIFLAILCGSGHKS